MKAVVQTIPAEIVRSRSRFSDFVDLTKPRLNFLVLVTTLAGFYLASRDSFNVVLMVHTLLGTALVAGGASALNQLMERDADAKMRRTEDRPLPAGRIQPHEALWFGLGMSLTGMMYLAGAVNLLTSQLATMTWLSYLFIYTPMKKESPFNTVVGAIPGAIPPMLGWTAVRDHISVEALVLFGVLFLWQFPHFLAIAWMYREDYARGEFKMLPSIDADGTKTARYSAGLTVALVLVSLLPAALGFTGTTYFIGALVLGLAFLTLSVCSLLFGVDKYARRVFFASVIYLPLLLALMTLNKR
jgi:protoheme IX farnesyltransferase